MAPLQNQNWGVCLTCHPTNYPPNLCSGCSRCSGAKGQALGPLSKSPSCDIEGETESSMTCYAWLHLVSFSFYLRGHLDFIYFNFLIRNNFRLGEKLQKQYKVPIPFTQFPLILTSYITTEQLSKLRNQHWYNSS